jgi:hypothetical protein
MKNKIPVEIAYKQYEQNHPDDFIKIPHYFIIRFGIDSALYLSYLILMQDSLSKNKLTDNSGGFILLNKKQTEDLNISKNKIIKLKQKLKNEKILLTIFKGCPAKEWYYINFKNLIQN